MSTPDRIIADLINALDTVARESAKPAGSLAYINGAAEQAIKMCNLHRVRNADGYLVVKNSNR
jgi:hypothetical protein